ncbi:MAG: S-layer homology domain-containing protein, partial [Clostridiales bacterium]|nr:S-layer homology domain-containing protein [Clostridiales bacterium]
NLERSIRNFEERGFTAADLLNLQNQYRDQLTTYITWYQPVTRQQMAAWIARALQLGGTYSGDMSKIYEFSDMRQIDTEKAPLIESLLQREIMSGKSSTHFAPNEAMTRAQLAQIMAKVHEDLLPIRNTTIKEGKILAIEDLEDKGIKKKVITLHNADDSKNLIITEENNRDFPVLRLGKLGLSKDLLKGDWVKYYIRNNEVIFAKVEPSKLKTVRGFVEVVSTDNQQLVMRDFNDQRHIFKIQPFAKIQINGKDTLFKDLIYGLEVTVTTDNQRVVEIQGYLEEDPERHGYIPPGSKTKVGDILFIDKDSVELRVDGKREKYRITDGTQILRSDRPANLFEVKEGDRVILSFDDIYSADIATLRVEDHERHIEGVYRGSIEQVNSRNRELILKNPYIYKDGKWIKDSKDQIKLRAEGNILYEGSRPILLNTLNNRKDQEAYVAVENSYNVPRVAKLLLKNGSSILYESKISDINFATSKMIVDNTAFTFHPGTIVIKNNRLVDNINLNKGQGVYVAGDILRGNRNAALIAIEYTGILDERVDSTRLVIYRGTVADIHHYGVTLGRLGYRLDYLKLEDNQWEEYRGNRKMTLTEDTFIFDSDIQKEIDPSHFIDTRYIDPEDIEDREIRERIEDKFYLDKTAYFVVKETYVDGDVYEEVLALNLTPTETYRGGRLHTEHSAMGEIQSVDMDSGNITLNNVRHWNSLNKRWERARDSETIDIDKAVIIVNDQPIDKDQLNLIRRKGQAYIIKNKNTSTREEGYVVIIEQ